jgi:transcriptional regulator with XRE-family HTH domain
MRQSDPSFSLSMRLVEWLKRQGKAQKDIAALLEVSESFISRVASGHRSLTIDHLAVLEDRLKLPLPVLLLESELAEQKVPEKRAVLNEALSLLRKSLTLRSELATLEKQPPKDSAGKVKKPKKGPKRESLTA